MKHRMGLSIKVTSDCEKLCSWCPVKSWMNSNKGYHLSLDHVRDLVKYSKESGYHWQFIMFSGGEPMLWENIIEGSRIIKESGITNQLITYTNAMIADRDLDKVVSVSRNVDVIKISVYDYNDTQVRKIATNIENVILINRSYFFKMPDEPVENSLPADCGCSAYGMIGNRISLCSFMEFMIAYRGWDIEQFKREFTHLKPNFLSDFDGINPFDRPMCSLCYGNMKVQKKCEKIKNGAFWL